ALGCADYTPAKAGEPAAGKAESPAPGRWRVPSGASPAPAGV
ncbi:MAG: hypothetical protein AVDCRST_MAG89-4039, partial [uncultured Gemmatimonadetes bacterium]